jgi:hypothetical protein
MIVKDSCFVLTLQFIIFTKRLLRVRANLLCYNLVLGVSLTITREIYLEDTLLKREKIQAFHARRCVETCVPATLNFSKGAVSSMLLIRNQELHTWYYQTIATQFSMF